MALTIVDSDILINVARGDAEAINCCQRLEKSSVLAISAVTQLELVVGCRNKTELRDLEKFLSRYQILKITDQISDPPGFRPRPPGIFFSGRCAAFVIPAIHPLAANATPFSRC